MRKAELIGLALRLVVLLPGAFSLLCESKFGATVHDDAHNAFITLHGATELLWRFVTVRGNTVTKCLINTAAPCRTSLHIGR